MSVLAELYSVRGIGESWPALALIADPDDAALTQSGVDAVTVAVYDLPDTDTNLWAVTQPAVSAVFYNTLQTGSGWNRTPGFNFKHIVDPDELSGAIVGGHTYLARYTIATVLHGARTFDHYVTVPA